MVSLLFVFLLPRPPGSTLFPYTTLFNSEGWLQRAGIGGLRIYGTVQNPFVLFSPYHSESGMDPEPNSRGNENQAVASYQSRLMVIGTNTPTNRNYMIGLNVSF